MSVGQSVGMPVHPRVCGERMPALAAFRILCGSSPRVWGTPANYVVLIADNRFIPACVGNAANVGSRHRKDAVHPRVCGER